VEIVDAQLHCWEADSPSRPWNPLYGTKDPAEAANRAHQSAHPVTYQELLRRMDATGVDAALLVTIAPYAPDNSYALEAAAAHPDRFAVVGRVDAAAADLERRIAGGRDAGMVGVRLIIGSEAERSVFRSGGFDRLFAACAKSRLPLCVYPPGVLPELAPVARRHPDLPLVIDHLGLPQPPLMRGDADPFDRLPELLALGRFPSVAVKLTGVPTLSRLPYPFEDLRPELRRLLDAFGPERLLWGSDNTRTEALHSYRQAVDFIALRDGLSPSEKELILGGSLRRIFGWQRASAPTPERTLMAGIAGGERASVRLGRTRLEYRRGGPAGGTPTLLLHPWFGCPGFWDPVLEALPDARWFAVDLYSPSAGPWDGVAAPGPLAGALATLLEAEGGAPAHVVGNSMGGILGQVLAAERPELVAKLVLVGTGASSVGLHSDFADRLTRWLADPDSRLLEQLTRGLVAGPAAGHPLVEACVRRLRAVDASYIAAVPCATLGLDLAPRLAAITAPTLVIRGELDSIRTAAHALQLVASIPNARGVEIEGGGHSPMLDSTASFNRLLAGFLAEP
jgi:pimeloyl-ACP methyl ester carboxylesterase/predicted TIM-barrel fold metal-dependent hydrolase